MSALENERHAATFELIGCVVGLVDQKVVPEYMREFLMSRVDRARRAYRQKEPTDA